MSLSDDLDVLSSPSSKGLMLKTHLLMEKEKGGEGDVEIVATKKADSSTATSSSGEGTESGKTGPDLLTKALDSLTCAICLDTYVEPKALPCLHSFCKECLEDALATNQNKRWSFRPPYCSIFITCPTCRAESKLPSNGVAGLPTNFFINQMLDLLPAEHRKKKEPLTNAGVSQDAAINLDDDETPSVVEFSAQPPPPLQPQLPPFPSLMSNLLPTSIPILSTTTAANFPNNPIDFTSDDHPRLFPIELGNLRLQLETRKYNINAAKVFIQSVLPPRDCKRLFGLIDGVRSGDIGIPSFVKHAALIFKKYPAHSHQFRKYVPRAYRGIYDDEILRSPPTTGTINTPAPQGSAPIVIDENTDYSTNFSTEPSYSVAHQFSLFDDSEDEEDYDYDDEDDDDSLDYDDEEDEDEDGDGDGDVLHIF